VTGLLMAAARGYSRDGKKGLTPESSTGCSPTQTAADRGSGVRAGNTADPAAFTEIVAVIRDTFWLEKPGTGGRPLHITTARIPALRELQRGGTVSADHRAARPRERPTRRRRRPLNELFDTPKTWPRSPTRLPRQRADRLPATSMSAERARKRATAQLPPRPSWRPSPTVCTAAPGRGGKNR